MDRVPGKEFRYSGGGYVVVQQLMMDVTSKSFPTFCGQLRSRAEVPELLTGQMVRFGFHNLRHSLASFLVDSGTDPKTVQDMLRQADVQTTLKFYAHSKHETKLAAQAQVLHAILQTPASEIVN